MTQQYIFDPIPCDKFDLLSKEEVVELCKGLQDFNRQLQTALSEATAKITSGEQKSFLLNEQLINIKHRLFGKSSEKSKTGAKGPSGQSSKKRVLLPSERYPGLDIIEKDVTLDKEPNCPCCSSKMKDTGMTEDGEYLTVIPKRYYVVRQKRHKYSCPTCQGAVVTAPLIPRVTPGSSYSDEMMVDVAMSKYLELVPVERYSSIAKREGVDLAPNSLIQLTHNLADFVVPVYEKIKQEVLASEIIHADETPHRMLEGDKKSNWYFWGFSNTKASYFEARDTRSGDVAVELLKGSQCRYLVSDVFSGYERAVAETNKIREGPKIQSLFCHAHARRKFKEAEKSNEDAEFFVRAYKAIYRLEKGNLETRRAWQRLYLEALKTKAQRLEVKTLRASAMGKAISYFLNNFEGLLRFTERDDLPIDNNAQERQLRTPVIGRKTWYGTHSRRGAMTASILFSIVESCKLNQVNPRQYLKDLIHSAHQVQGVFTPAQYAERSAQNNG